MKRGLMGKLCSLVALLFFMISCGGGGGGDSANVNPPTTVQEGTFIDSAVEGLEYETATQSGVTDAAGTFRFQTGETITFSMGNVIIGQATGKETITPMDLVPSAVDVTNPTVTNICRLLQSLDEDGNVNNGIRITQAMRDEIDGKPIDFNLSIAEFETDVDVLALFNTLNALGVFTDEAVRALRTTEQAQNHLRQTLNQNTSNGELKFPGAYYIEHNVHCWDSEENVESFLESLNNISLSHDVNKNAYYYLYDMLVKPKTYDAFFPDKTCEEICDQYYVENEYKTGSPYDDQNEHGCFLSWRPDEIIYNAYYSFECDWYETDGDEGTLIFEFSQNDTNFNGTIDVVKLTNEGGNYSYTISGEITGNTYQGTDSRNRTYTFEIADETISGTYYDPDGGETGYFSSPN